MADHLQDTILNLSHCDQAHKHLLLMISLQNFHQFEFELEIPFTDPVDFDETSEDQNQIGQ